MASSDLNADALDAYVFGYSIVLMETTQRNMLAGGSQTNRFTVETTFPGPETRIVVRPNVDTLYNTAWLDLSAEPIVLRVPDTGGKYYVLEFLDDWTNVFASVGERTTGTAAGDFLIAGPEWDGGNPRRLPVICAPTNTVWLLGRIQTDGPMDYPLVHALQQGFLLAPLGYWERYGFAGVTNLSAQSPALRIMPPKDQVEAMDAAVFFRTLAAAMQANPPVPPDAEMERKLAGLGLNEGAAFDYGALPAAVRQALDAAAKAGPAAILMAGAGFYREIQANGWSMPVTGVGYYDKHYMRRAVTAMNFLGANMPQDAVYGFAFTDDGGQPLSGGNRYVLRFDRGELPPTRAFWSVTLYDGEGFLAPNPIGRYAVAPHLGNAVANADGSMDIFIQHTSPGAANAPNWLPAPEGQFNLLLRLYWPCSDALNGQWKPEAVRKVTR